MSRKATRLVYGICQNRDYKDGKMCPLCASREIQHLRADEDFVCAECGEELRAVPAPKPKWNKKRISIFVVIGVLVVAAVIIYLNIRGEVKIANVDDSNTVVGQTLLKVGNTDNKGQYKVDSVTQDSDKIGEIVMQSGTSGQLGKGGNPDQLPPEPPNSRKDPGSKKTINPNPVPGDLTTALQYLISQNYSTEQRLKLMPKIETRFFASDAHVITAGRDGVSQIMYEEAEAFLRRLALSDKLKKIIILEKESDAFGKISLIKVHEIR